MRHFVIDVFRAIRWLARRVAARQRARAAGVGNDRIDATSGVVELPVSVCGREYATEPSNELRVNRGLPPSVTVEKF